MKRLSNEQIGRVVERARAMSDVTRVRILDALVRAELSVGQLATTLEAEPSLMSKHLQVLFRAGLVVRRKDASTVIYSLATDQIVDICHYLGTPALDVDQGRLR